MPAAVYELEGEGLDGQRKFFTKPWAMTTVMFLGMSFCLPLAYLEQWRARKGKLTAAEEPLLGGAEAGPLPGTCTPVSCTSAAMTLVAAVHLHAP